MRVLLTGAAGFIGSHMVDRLVGRGDYVLGVDNFDPFYSPEEKRRNLAGVVRGPGRFELVEADIRDAAGLRAAVAGREFDVVLHLAAKAGVRPSLEDPSGYVSTNVVGTQNLLDLVRELKVGRFVFGSSSSVYGNSAPVPFSEDDSAVQPISPYAATKRAGELLCYTHHDLYRGSVICLRFFTVYGPRQRPDLAIRKFCTRIADGRPIDMYGDGTTQRDYTWVDDIADGVVAALDRGEKYPDEFDVINLGGSRSVTLRRLIDLLGESLGVEPVVRQLPAQPGDVRNTWADVAKAGRLLGFQPRTEIEQGIRKFVEWFRSTTPASASRSGR